MRCYRKILRISYQEPVTNEEVRAKIQQAIGPYEDLRTIVKRRKLQWYGHVFRSSGLAKTVLQGTVKRGRTQGRQSGSFPISNGVKQGCTLAPILFSIFFSIMLQEANEDLPDGIYISIQADGSLFNLWRLLACTKPIKELIIELLFADNYVLLAHTEEAFTTSLTASLMQPRTLASPSA